MTNIYYQEQVLENIARKVLCGYDSALYYGSPAAVPIEEMIEAHGVSLEYQYLRKNGRILGKTIFDEGLEAVYDMENREYTLFPVEPAPFSLTPRSVRRTPAQAVCALPAPTSWPIGYSTKSCTPAQAGARL